MKTIFLGFAFALFISCQNQSEFGIFEKSEDVGEIKHKGSVKFDSQNGSYKISGGGANMWAEKDALHYLWKKTSGDVSLAADIKWIGNGGDQHRKACLIIRQDLEESSAYADIAVHGDGLTSIQYREVKGGITREVQSSLSAPKRVRIEKEADYVSMSVSEKGEELTFRGGMFKIVFEEPFYIGLGVCAHNNDTIETALFSDVVIESLKKNESEADLQSTLETVPIASGDRRVVYHSSNHIESPRWSQDGKSLIYKSGDNLFKIPVEGGEPTRFNDDSYSQIGSADGTSRIISAERNGNQDIYRISKKGMELRLTSADSVDACPDYSADGKQIYFSSERSGKMEIWRMNNDGSEQQQITSDDYNDWYSHPSPDGNWLIFLSYETGIEGSPENKDVILRLMSLENGEIQDLAKLFGGEGTINMPSWSPESSSLAFVSYRLVR